MRNQLLTNHRRDIKTQGEGRWTRQGWIYPMFDVIRHIFTIPLQNQRNSKGEKTKTYPDGTVEPTKKFTWYTSKKNEDLPGRYRGDDEKVHMVYLQEDYACWDRIVGRVSGGLDSD